MVGRTVVVIEDIVDTGYTMQRMVAQLYDLGAADVRVSTLLRKPAACRVPDLKIDYAALEIPNDFIVGYGLDYDEEGRNLPEIYVVND
jgi:hypoxanthine phosphoribosyltransferase